MRYPSQAPQGLRLSGLEPLRQSEQTMDRFNSWLGAQPAVVRAVTCGNHEYPVEAEPEKWRKRLTNATVLLNESLTIEGIKVWSSPVTRCEVELLG
jgi:hypothetical protein